MDQVSLSCEQLYKIMSVSTDLLSQEGRLGDGITLQLDNGKPVKAIIQGKWECIALDLIELD